MPEFQVFRLKVYPSKQISLFEKEKKPPDILKDVIESLPSAELRKGLIWHIGNVKNLDKAGLYLRIGRATTSTIEIYQDGNFLDQEFETAPYTHAIIDTNLEICAIAKKTRLSLRILGIANQLVKLFNESERGRYFQVRFEIDEITDPEDFIAYLHKALAISKFWITFSKPNPFDVNKDFIEPMGRLLRESDGERGKTELEGESLNPDKLEALARSAASTGDNAGAWLVPSQAEAKVKKHLKGNPVMLKQEDLSDDDQKRNLLEKIRALYHKIRGKIK
jgi:hypothetical protein